jgi:hypothetical protein
VLIKGHVRNGRLVVDEPTDLPEGEEVDLTPLVGYDDDELTAEDEEGIRLGLAQIDQGETVPADQVFAEIRESLKARRR